MIKYSLRISKVFLFMGEPLEVTHSIKVKHPTLRMIFDEIQPRLLADVIYQNYLATLVCDPYDNMVWLDDHGINYQKVTPFDLFYMKMEDDEKQVARTEDSIQSIQVKQLFSAQRALNFFLEGEHHFITATAEDGTKLLYDTNDTEHKTVITKDDFNSISAFVQMIHNITERKDKINPQTESARKMLIEDMRDEQKRKQRKQKKDEDSDFLGDILMGVLHGGSGNVTPENFADVPIYLLTSGMTTIQKQMSFMNVMTGVYTGNVKYSDVTEKQLAWMQ